MEISMWNISTNPERSKGEIWTLVEKLYPTHRSLVSDGFTKSLNIVKDLLKQNLSTSNKNLNDIFNTSRVLGSNPKLAKKKMDDILNSSLELPFKDAYNNAKNFDQFFGDSIS